MLHVDRNVRLSAEERSGHLGPVLCCRIEVKRAGITGQRLAAIFLLGGVLFNYPIVSLFAGRATILGIPAPYAFVFGTWALLIGLMAVVTERRRE